MFLDVFCEFLHTTTVPRKECRRHCWCAHTTPPTNFQCSHRVALAPLCIICTLHLIAGFASHLSTGIIPAISSFLTLYVSMGRAGREMYFPRNFLLSFYRNMKSAVHVSYARWLILSYSVLACTHDFKYFLSSIQVFCCKTFTMLWYDDSYRSLCMQSCVSLPLCHLTYRRLSALIWLQAPVSFFSCFCTSLSLPLFVLHLWPCSNASRLRAWVLRFVAGFWSPAAGSSSPAVLQRSPHQAQQFYRCRLRVTDHVPAPLLPPHRQRRVQEQPDKRLSRERAAETLYLLCNRDYSTKPRLSFVALNCSHRHLNAYDICSYSHVKTNFWTLTNSGNIYIYIYQTHI